MGGLQHFQMGVIFAGAIPFNDFMPDGKALETLQQILFFREFDISLKEIKAVLDNPALERNQILQVQRKMLVTKKERMERLIASIDDILKGENKMDFTIFTKTEVEEMFQTSLDKGTQRKTTENELPSLTQCTA